MNYNKELKIAALVGKPPFPSDAIEELNNKDAKEKVHELLTLLSENNNISELRIKENVNTFVVRAIFCFFFESTDKLNGFSISEIIKELLIIQCENPELYIDEFFNEFKQRSIISNIGLVKNNVFEEHYPTPVLNSKILHLLLSFKDINWKQVDFNIIYSVFAEFNPELNIKLINRNEVLDILNALFLEKINALVDEYDHSSGYLSRLRKKISTVKVFDPNCNCGQFLIVAYEELCNLELKIIDKLKQIGKTTHIEMVRTSQLFGMEKNNTMYLLTRLSLSIFDYNIQLKRKLSRNTSKLDFSYNNASIIKTDGLTANWDRVCPVEGSGIYVISNCYSAKESSTEPKQDKWLVKVANYLADNNAEACFLFKSNISLNKDNYLSWRYVFERRVHISFVYGPFKKRGFNKKAVIVGFSAKHEGCFIYSRHAGKTERKEVKVITPSFNSNPLTLNYSVSLLPKDFPPCKKGIPVSSGKYLLLSEKEKDKLVAKEPRTAKWIKKLIGTDELNETIHNWCLSYEAIPYKELTTLRKVKELMYGITTERQKGFKDFNYMVNIFSSSDYINSETECSIIIPEYSASSRAYYPIGFYRTKDIIPKTFVINNASLYMFGILSSSMFNEWIRLLTDNDNENIYFSIKDFYESFPWPSPTVEQIALIESVAEEILYVRESLPHYNIRNLYGLTTMPIELLDTHIKLDRIVEAIFSPLGFSLAFNKRQILSYMYEKLISERT